MRKTILIVVILGLCGCGAMGSLHDKAVSGYAVQPLTAESIEPSRQLINAIKTGGDGFEPVSAICFSTVVPTANVAECTQARNQMVSGLMAGSNAICEKHKTYIYGNDAISNITFGTLTSLFSGASAVANPESTKTVLAALALFSNSERSLVNETVYKQMLVTQIGAKVDQLRTSAKSEIDLSLKSDINAFGMNQAINGIVNYHSQCSFMNALQAAVSDGAAPSQKVKVSEMKAKLAALAVEIRTIPISERGAGQLRQFEYDALNSRYSALSKKIEALESSD